VSPVSAPIRRASCRGLSPDSLARSRTGRGSSYAVDREIEDIEALTEYVGGPPFLYGHSSGGHLAMRAAIRLGGKVGKIAMYEPPRVSVPALVMAGDAGLPFMPDAARVLSRRHSAGRGA
jgi:pimeloyl-ACP methyl ester carboxylesterase